MHVGSHAMLVAAGFLGADGSMAVAAVVDGSALVGAAGGGGGGGARLAHAAGLPAVSPLRQRAAAAAGRARVRLPVRRAAAQGRVTEGRGGEGRHDANIYNAK